MHMCVAAAEVRRCVACAWRGVARRRGSTDLGLRGVYSAGPPAYFSDNWCRFDFFLVCTSLLDEFASELLANVLPLPPMLLRVLRVLRILRILRLLKGAKELRNLIITMVLSFPSLLNVGSLLTLVIFIYAVLGLNLFTFIVHQVTEG